MKTIKINTRCVHTLTHAIGTANDFELVSVRLTFNGSLPDEELCHAIATYDDELVEFSEHFSIHLTSLRERVTVPVSSTQVVIEDNDGMSYIILYML